MSSFIAGGASLTLGTEWGFSAKGPLSFESTGLVFGGILGDSTVRLTADQASGKLVAFTMPHSCSSWTRSAGDARFSTNRSSSCSSCTVPARQGRHLPQLSATQKRMKYRASSGIAIAASITTMPPEPMIEPSSCRLA